MPIARQNQRRLIGKQRNHSTLNINGVLRTSRNWYAGMKKTHSTTGAIAGGFARLVAMHRAGGALDLAHDDESDYVGSAEMGNFLYGANGRAMGLPGWALIRGAAGYQAISNHGYTWRSFSQGVVNFIQDEGDKQGNPAQTIRGIKHHDEVFVHNINNPNKMSCQDIESKSENGTSTGPGGGEGGNGGNNSWGGGQVIIGGSGGSKTCFVQDGFATYCWAN
ncbi:polymorphic toxin type 44 domain-containing protein [Pseudoalteromonas fuliginea]|nr:polymorphic toxin type 44 domain-containing protein [Pseudoalteromonas fuliginea]